MMAEISKQNKKVDPFKEIVRTHLQHPKFQMNKVSKIKIAIKDALENSNFVDILEDYLK